MSELLDRKAALEALRATGQALADSGAAPVRLAVVGGVAGLLGGLLGPPRTTLDCDVMWTGGDEQLWNAVEEAAQEVGKRLGLQSRWLNRDCRAHAWCLMLGWQRRCEVVGQFGPLEVVRLSRIDLMAAKIVSAPRRPHDLRDIQVMKPTLEELVVIESHLDRLEAEDADGNPFEKQRALLERLRSQAREA